MKKILPFTLMTILALPAFADEETNAITAVTDDSVQAYDTDTRNPKTKFPRGMQLGLGVSATSGLNGFIGYANKDFESFWWKRLGVRLDFGTMSPVKNVVNSAIDSALGDGVEIGDGLTVDGGTLSANHFGALVDFYPFGNTWFAGGWRLSGGYFTGKMNLAANMTGEVEGMPDGSIEFDLDEYTFRYNGGDLRGKAGVNWKYAGPYLGTGFDLGLFRGIKIYFDAGVVFTNKTAQLGLDVPLNDNLQVWDPVAEDWKDVKFDATENPTTEYQEKFEQAKAAALKEGNDELSDLKWYPLFKLGFMYRF